MCRRLDDGLYVLIFKLSGTHEDREAVFFATYVYTANYGCFMVKPLPKEIGSSAILTMMIPCVMIHIGKPMTECFAAIIAGIVLGTPALRTRSIWVRAPHSCERRPSMDFLSIWHNKSRLG